MRRDRAWRYSGDPTSLIRSAGASGFNSTRRSMASSTRSGGSAASVKRVGERAPVHPEVEDIEAIVVTDDVLILLGLNATLGIHFGTATG